ncbi:MAG TPA: hypothetical protein VK525_06940 [Candidatus Saccharimonadales bacterium]|nr:hypothetical protein [Candidatus Saccharimonadales bacterium]
MALAAPRASRLFFQKIETAISDFSLRTGTVALLLFVGIIALRLAVLPLVPRHVPGIHDEFSYLLAADTFLHGRLANPTHPLWMSFESFHINWFPTYSSIYPPAQGALLALGKILGNPWIGIVLSVGAMSVAIFWMLLAWFPSRWSLLGAALAAVKLGIASYWMNSYWGGSVAAIGGALVLGAMPRIVRRANTRDALLLALGIGILANSRPYEGFIFCLPVAAWFLSWLVGKTKSRDRASARIRRTFLPLAAALTLLVGWMGYYNWRLTGSPLLLPHTVNERRYHSAPMFVWGDVKEPLEYNNQTFYDFYTGWEREEYQRNWSKFWYVSQLKLTRYAPTYFWMGFFIALPGLFFVLRDRRTRFLLVSSAFAVFAMFSVVWANPHYISPWTCVFFALLVQAIRHVRLVRRARRHTTPPMGIALSWAVAAVLLLDTSRLVSQHACDTLEWTCQGDPSRASVSDRLSQLPGKHLVIVHYTDDDHNIHDEWVYNDADIDGAKIIWARELTPEQNARLLAYFRERSIWWVDPDNDNTELVPYPPKPEE